LENNEIEYCRSIKYFKIRNIQFYLIKMSFNIQCQEHKIKGWERFYIEYAELKDYLRQARVAIKDISTGINLI
jgi:hypothetical protein